MAESFEPYHVPQQSRRDKLRVVIQNHPGCVENLQGCTGLVPFYDPSLIPSDLLTNFHHQNKSTSNPTTNTACGGGVKEEGLNLMGYVGGMIAASSSSSTSHHLYMDPQSSIQFNPSSIQDINNNPFLYNPQNLLDHSFNGGGEVVVYNKPEPLSNSIANEPYTTTGQGLSLSLSSHQSTHNQSNLPLELNLQRYESPMFSDKVNSGYGIGGGGSTPTDLSRTSFPLGPFTGYTSILKGSRFLKPAQQLLEELCNVSRVIYSEKITADSAALMDSDHLSSTVDDPQSCSDGGENRRKKSRLISMLDEVFRRYKHYYQQMQAVVASFESVAGLSNAAPFANLALNAMSKHFRCLKNAITDQLYFTTKSHGHMNCEKDETPRLGNTDRGLYSQRPAQNSGFIERQPVWRPQRGLPECAVTVLRAWLFEHFLHPYPTDTDKQILAKRTGLSRNQVSNWFINARVRLWKPMVEEIHMLETRQARKSSPGEEQNTNRGNHHLPSTNSVSSENPSTSTQRIQELPFKRTRNDFPDVLMGSDEPMNFLSYDNLSRQPHLSAGVSTAGGGGGVSLTLGLHQNNGIGLLESFPMNAARRFGLDANSEGYRQLGREIIGGQHLHDFVG